MYHGRGGITVMLRAGARDTVAHPASVPSHQARPRGHRRVASGFLAGEQQYSLNNFSN